MLETQVAKQIAAMRERKVSFQKMRWRKSYREEEEGRRVLKSFFVFARSDSNGVLVDLAREGC